jgi:hypothetical protein
MRFHIRHQSTIPWDQGYLRSHTFGSNLELCRRKRSGRPGAGSLSRLGSVAAVSGSAVVAAGSVVDVCSSHMACHMLVIRRM